MKEKVKIALVQLETRLADKSFNVDKAIEKALSAVGEGAELIVFPELSSTGYNLNVIGTQMKELSETLSGEIVTRLCSFCKEHRVMMLYPMALNLGAERPHNSAVLISENGEVKGVYSKCHLYGAERDFFEAGDEFTVFDTNLGKIGVMICYDAGFPESARILRSMGAELILCPSAWNAKDKLPWDLNMQQRAQENSCFLAAVNRYGKEDSLYMAGWSQVTDPFGAVLVKAAEEKEQTLLCEIDGTIMNKLGPEGGPYLHYRRPELYQKAFQKGGNESEKDI